MKNKCIIGGIIKHKNGGYGFKVTFDNPELAKKYKDMIYWIIKNDDFTMEKRRGVYDA